MTTVRQVWVQTFIHINLQSSVTLIYISNVHFVESPAASNTVEHGTHDLKVVGSNLTGGISQWAELDEKKIKGPVVYVTVYGPGT